MLNKAASFAQKTYQATMARGFKRTPRSVRDQLLRASESVGANIAEAISAYTVKDRIHKFSIAYKEAAEVDWWLDRLKASGEIDQSLAEELFQDIDEIRRMIFSARRTLEKQGG